MRHEVHYHNPEDTSHSAHVAHTERAAWNKVPDPERPDQQIDFIDFIAKLINNPALQKGTGLDQPSNHPEYPGKTILQVIVAEIMRRNDTDALRAIGKAPRG